MIKQVKDFGSRPSSRNSELSASDMGQGTQVVDDYSELPSDLDDNERENANS